MEKRCFTLEVSKSCSFTTTTQDEQAGFVLELVSSKNAVSPCIVTKIFKNYILSEFLYFIQKLHSMLLLIFFKFL